MFILFFLSLAILAVQATPPQTCTCSPGLPPHPGLSGFPGFQQPQGFAQPQGFQSQPLPFATPGPSFSAGASCPPPITFNCPPPPACPPQAPCLPAHTLPPHTPHPFFATHPLFTTTFSPQAPAANYNQNNQYQNQNQNQDCGGVTPQPGSYNAVDQHTAAPTYQQPQPLQPLPEQQSQNYGSQQQGAQGGQNYGAQQQGGQYSQQGGQQQPLPVAEQGAGAGGQPQQVQPQRLPQQGQYENQGQDQGQAPDQQQQQQQYQGQDGQQTQEQGQQQQSGQYQEGQGQQQQLPDGNQGGDMKIHVYREGENTNADYVEAEQQKKAANMDYETNNEAYRKRRKQLGAPTVDVIDETKCNNEKLRKIMLEVTDDNPSSSKRKIQKEAMEKIGGIFDVICSNGDFSYLANTRLYCETRVKDTICFAFLHNALP